MLTAPAADVAEAAPQPQLPFLYSPGQPSRARSGPVTAALRRAPRDSGQSRPAISIGADIVSNDTHNLFTSDATGAARPATADEILDAARTILASRCRRGASISNPRHTREYLRLHLAPRDHEIFAILFLDNRHRVIEFVPMFRGTIDGASVYPREVVKEALARNAAAVILAHNHPSGVAEPSQADEVITTRLRDALALIDVRVLDHLVVTGDAIVSFAERGLL